MRKLLACASAALCPAAAVHSACRAACSRTSISAALVQAYIACRQLTGYAEDNVAGSIKQMSRIAAGCKQMRSAALAFESPHTGMQSIFIASLHQVLRRAMM